MSGRKYVLRSRGEATLMEAFKEQGEPESVALARACRTYHFLNRCGARVFHWTEVIMALLFCAALSLVGGIIVGLAAGVK